LGAEKNWNKLKKRYEEHGLVLALGAGVSAGCNLPSWDQLLCRIAVRCYEKEEGKCGKCIYRQLRESGYPLPAIASILEAKFLEAQREGKFPRETPFYEIIREAIYAEFPFFKEKIEKERPSEFIEFVQKNKTLRAVASLCAWWNQSDQTYSPNPSIHAVANFNLDSVLQAYSRVRYQDTRLLGTVERPSAGLKPDRIPVYHMHGYLKFAKEHFANPEEEAPDLRVLSEQEYFNFFDRPNRLFNYTFLYLLHASSCLFVGMSMKDDNIRRLLHYSKTEKEESYIREGKKKRKAEKESMRHFAMSQYSGSPEVDNLTEKSLRRLGTRVLWVKDFEEIPDRLADLYKSTCGNWQAVYENR
jgi:hypothetical protein